MQVHRLGVAGRQDQGCALALLWADRAEDVGGSGALVAGRAWTGAALRPAAGDLVLLADTSLVGEPDFYRVDADRLLTRYEANHDKITATNSRLSGVSNDGRC